MEQILDQLDEIERCEPDPNYDAGALQLMERLVDDESGLRLLGERYGLSKSTNIARYLALLLARKARSPGFLSPETVIFLIGRLVAACDPETLISCTDAVSSTVLALTNDRQHSSTLARFLNTCLEYSGRLRSLVQHGALQIVADLSDQRLLENVFEGDQLVRLREQIVKLSAENDDLLTIELSRIPPP